MRVIARVLLGALVSGVVGVGAAGCGPTGGAYELPLPGGADLGDRPITLTVEFSDVLDLVPHSSVQLNHVDVGQVQSIRLTEDGSAAQVTLRVRGDLDLPEDTSARVQQTSLLGEKYVALLPGAADTQMRSGDRIPAARTSEAVGAEDVLGALSALLNGGGVGQLQDISREVQQTGGGRTGEIRQFLESTEVMVAELDKNRRGVVDAVDGVHEMSGRLAENKKEIATVLDDLRPGLAELAKQREDFTRLLVALDRLSRITVRTVDRAGDDMVADLKALDPVLKQLAASGAALPASLEMLLTFPFTDAVLAAVRGDFINVFVKLRLAVSSAGGVVRQPEEGR